MTKNKEKTINIIDKVRERFQEKIISRSNLGNSEWKLLDCGSYGCAYDVGNGKVVKITGDYDEACAADKVMKIGGVPGVYHIYDVFMTGNKYVVVQERLNKSSDSTRMATKFVGDIIEYDDDIAKIVYNWSGMRDLLDAIREIKHKALSFFRDGEAKMLDFVISQGTHLLEPTFSLAGLDWEDYYYSFQDESDDYEVGLEDNFADGFRKVEKTLLGYRKNEVLRKVNIIAQAVAELRRVGIEFYDVHDGNVMEDAKGNPVIIDLGVSNVVGCGKLDLVEDYIRGIIGEH